MRSILKALAISGVCSLVLLSACGGGGDNGDQGMMNKIGEAAKTMKDAAKGMSEVAKDYQDIQNMKPVPPVNYTTLIKFLPNDAFGLKREKPQGETGQMGEFKWSKASVEFTDPQPNTSRHVVVTIFDYAYIPAMYVPYKMALSMNYNKESSSGYEKSTQILGYPAYEKWDKDSKDEEVTVLVSKRFIVTVSSQNLDAGEAAQLATSMSLLDLADQGQAPS